MKAKGARGVLVSGGFTVFADEVARYIGFDRAISNTLGIEGGRLTGTVARPVVDSAVKKATLLAEAEAARIPLDATLAVGDGANDVPMIERSEEHTSELQSLMRISYAVFCLKKKTTKTHIILQSTLTKPKTK